MQERLLPSILFLALLGALISGYLAYVKWSGTSAVCGPIGECNSVQDSPAARIAGITPVAWLGMMGYAAILVAWAHVRGIGGRTGDLAAVAARAMTSLGRLFSICLTYLEPFDRGNLRVVPGLGHGHDSAAVAYLWSGRSKRANLSLRRGSRPTSCRTA
jgi:uncharacterized membrane protein